MRRTANIKFNKRKKKRKGPKLEFSETCDYCQKPLQVCRVRNEESCERAVRYGYPAKKFGGISCFFCSDECLEKFEDED